MIQESETIKESDVVNYYNSTPLKNRPKEGSPSYGSIRKNEIKNYATS